MSLHGSATDLAAGASAPHADPRRKKRPQRAFHDTQFALPHAPFAAPAQPFALPSLFSAGSVSPGASPLPFFTPVQPSTPLFPQGAHVPAQAFSPAAVGGPAAALTPAMAALSVSQLPETASPQPPGLSLSSARHAQQHEFCTPLAAENGASLGYKQFLSFQNIVPPIAGTQYHAVDQGTATPRHMRTTFYNVPELEALRRATRLPVAVTVRPFAPVLPTEMPVPTVDHSRLGETPGGDALDAGPPRCNRCRTYINPAMAHTPLGRFTCNVCQFPNNSVPPEYVAPVDPATGQRTDQAVRPELHRGVYDIVVPKYYNFGGAHVEAQPLHHVFLVDISHQSVARHLPVLLADAMRAVFFDYAAAGGAAGAAASLRFAIILFDTKMHFFNLAPHLDAAQLCVSGDLDDPFVPFSVGLFADPDRSRLAIEDALNKLELFSHEHALRDPEPCFSVALRTAQLCLEPVGGGKITLVLSTLSSWGPGRSKIKQNRNVGRTQLAEAEKALYSPDNEYYKLLAKDFLALNVGLDVFVVSDTPADLSNVGWLALVTGGSVSKWLDFVFERDGRSFTAQIVASVRKCTGYQGQLKLRCSNGLQVSQYYGFPTTADGGIVGFAAGALQDPIIPVLNEDQSFTVLLEYDGQLNTKYDCHFQAALLYTDPQGVRKVRVINLVLAVSERLLDVFNFVDQDAVVATVLRDTISFLGKESIDELRKSLNEKLVEIFTAYRAMSEPSHNRNSPMANQLVFPDSLKHLPSYFLSLIKSKALRDSSSISLDTRLCDIFQMLYMPLDKLVFHLYPAMVELHSLAEDEGMPYDDPENTDDFIKLPEFKSLTAASLESGVYILCDGTTVYVRVHPDSNKLLLKDVFGDHIESCEDIDPLLDSLPDLPTHISQQARNLVRYFRENVIGCDSIGSSAIVIVRDGMDSRTHEFRDCLTEDKLASKALNTSPNYSEFLSALHKAVKVKLENEKRPREKTKDVVHNNETLAQRMIQF
ncbi:beta-sandwich domain of Sec23/24 [Metschnikowia bicuspidata var. bicuspidata NRRL YB-4993]|uniref:Beta-sandwich domain of Sec23/24 n=1 Tax=Metschnikowia bicuspidata var. bicuspidata NRRL YB-4993 TaxID=869754 RepID=A0A1A0HHC6_9ASCO|nr:beta-sandwich domain of Sec23/24 [Metschnikowia bicuspidata var. bicuspidata NRRL YB-4993]OBA23243.1 beta-sandwich domain of Sec23/24 [Metschnikowia bicuspidata var. bicuspidata NRRL YB-4993]